MGASQALSSLALHFAFERAFATKRFGRTHSRGTRAFDFDSLEEYTFFAFEAVMSPDSIAVDLASICNALGSRIVGETITKDFEELPVNIGRDARALIDPLATDILLPLPKPKYNALNTSIAALTRDR